MKKLFIISVYSLLLISCGAMNRKLFGNTEEDLIKQISIETGCETGKIKILEKMQNLGNATYAVDVCGKRMVYKQVGSVFMTADEADNLMKKK